MPLFSFVVYLAQESIVDEVNSNPQAGWVADFNTAFTNYSVRLSTDWPTH